MPIISDYGTFEAFQIIDNLTDLIVGGRSGLLRDVLKESFRVNVLGCSAAGDIALNIPMHGLREDSYSNVRGAGHYSADIMAVL